MLVRWFPDLPKIALDPAYLTNTGSLATFKNQAREWKRHFLLVTLGGGGAFKYPINSVSGIS